MSTTIVSADDEDFDACFDVVAEDGFAYDFDTALDVVAIDSVDFQGQCDSAREIESLETSGEEAVALVGDQEDPVAQQQSTIEMGDSVAGGVDVIGGVNTARESLHPETQQNVAGDGELSAFRRIVAEAQAASDKEQFEAFLKDAIHHEELDSISSGIDSFRRRNLGAHGMGLVLTVLLAVGIGVPAYELVMKSGGVSALIGTVTNSTSARPDGTSSRSISSLNQVGRQSTGSGITTHGSTTQPAREPTRTPVGQLAPRALRLTSVEWTSNGGDSPGVLLAHRLKSSEPTSTVSKEITESVNTSAAQPSSVKQVSDRKSVEAKRPQPVEVASKSAEQPVKQVVAESSTVSRFESGKIPTDASKVRKLEAVPQKTSINKVAPESSEARVVEPVKTPPQKFKPLQNVKPGWYLRVAAEEVGRQQNLAPRVGDLTINGHTPVVYQVVVNGKTYVRLVVGPFSTKGRATEVLSSLKSKPGLLPSDAFVSQLP